jgi:hypothetical protein
MDSSYTWLSSSPPSAALAITFAVASFLVFAASLLQPARAAVLPGPARTALTPAAKEELKQLVGGNTLPGARDVETPYGSIRVYEFGPEDGKKVLLVHGISTSSMTLEPIAKSLSSSGCRVMLFVSPSPLEKPPSAPFALSMSCSRSPLTPWATVIQSLGSFWPWTLRWRG